MKQIFRFAAVVAAIASFFACQEKEGPDTPELKAPTVTVDPTGKIALSEDAKDADALTISWTSVAADAEYTLNITPAKEADYSKAWKKTTNETSVKFTTEELQQVLLGLGYAQGDLATVKAMVQATSGDLTSTSADARIQCTLYAKSVALSAPVITLNSTEVVLTEAAKDETALTATWTDAVPAGEDVYVDYTFEWTLATDTDFAAASKVATEEREFSATANDLQYAFYGLGFKAGETVNLLCRVKAEPAVASIEAVTSETVAFSIKLWEKEKNTNIPTSLCVVGNAVSWGWNNGSPDGMFTCTDATLGIFEWTGVINNIDTFQFLLDCNWNIGITPGEGEYYWTDMKYANPLKGDRDYQRLLVPGTWNFVINTTDITVDLTLIETSLEYVTVVLYAGEESIETQIPVKDKTKATFEGPINLIAATDFVVYTDVDNKNRGFACHPSSPQAGTSWKSLEFREEPENNAKTPFQVLDSGDYLMTMDLINHTMSIVAQ